MKEFFVDFHCHPTLRAINTQPVNVVKNMWDKTYNNTSINTPISRWARMKTREIAKESQTNFYEYVNNNFRVVFDSLYPVEKGWFKFRKMTSVVMSEKAREEIMLVAMGIEKPRLDHLKNSKSYFDELIECYEFLLDGQGDSPDGNYQYKLVSNFSELEFILNHEPNTLAVVVNIEGAHSLECGLVKSRKRNTEDLQSVILNNIRKIKSWRYPPFSVTVAHHFYNQLCGHARSFKHPMNVVFNQRQGLGIGMLDLGWRVIEELLSNQNGKRILIDIKHMSIATRKDFYQYIIKHNTEYPGDTIPIICSHTGVSGYETMEEACWNKDNRKKSKKSYYNNWSINLSNEEIRIIHDSGGMIGVMMDKGLLGGHKTINRIKKIADEKLRQVAFLKLVLDNIFTIIKSVNKKTAWDIITIGTDYDGLIMHIEGYESAAKIPVLKRNLIEYLKATEYNKDLWYDMRAEELMDKVFSINSIMFMKKHFV